jgi:hypothetical protein
MPAWSTEGRADVVSAWLLAILFVASTAWIVKAVVPRVLSPPVSAPLQETMDSAYRQLAAGPITPAGPIELGVAIRPVVAGEVIAVRFYKVDGDRGRHVAHLWNDRGQLLASAPFRRESRNGWQEAELPRAVPVVANQSIVASYFSPTASSLADSSSVFVNQPHTRSMSDAFHFPESDPTAGPSNFYRLGSPGFPSTGTMIHQFWVDVAFVRAGRSR